MEVPSIHLCAASVCPSLNAVISQIGLAASPLRPPTKCLFQDIWCKEDIGFISSPSNTYLFNRRCEVWTIPFYMIIIVTLVLRSKGSPANPILIRIILEDGKRSPIQISTRFPLSLLHCGFIKEFTMLCCPRELDIPARHNLTFGNIIVVNVVQNISFGESLQ